MLERSFSVDDVKRAARGQWLAILKQIGGMTEDQLNPKKNHPCPKCGGTDRFNAHKDIAETGGVHCRGCSVIPKGDGLAVLQWLLDEPFGIVLAKVAAYVGIAQGGTERALAKTAATSPKKAKATNSELIKAYDYKDESGRLLFQAVRFEGKKFKQRRPKQGGGWEWSLGDVRLVPYRLPAIVAADPSDWVYVCEGEKDCDAMAGIGLVATCNNGGAGKWLVVHSLCLAGRKVCVLPDQDVAGRKHCRIVCEGLLAHGCQVRVVDLPSGKDAADWLEAGGDAPELARLTDAASDLEAGGWADDDSELAEAEGQPGNEPKRVTLLVEEMRRHVARIGREGVALVKLGVSEIDRALAGGVEFGEQIVVAALPSHGKSMLALQFIHHWTANGLPCAFLSEEMIPEMIGKRAVQFASELRTDDWQKCQADLVNDIDNYAAGRAPAYVIAKTGNLQTAIEEMTELAENQGVRCFVVDYLQMLSENARSSYEGVTAVSKALAKFTRDHKVILCALAQHNRELEKREQFVPKNSDLKDSGQIGADADVILHLVWPHRLCSKLEKDKYLIYVGKNRNREIVEPMVECVFDPARQRVVCPRDNAKTHPAYNPSFENFQ